MFKGIPKLKLLFFISILFWSIHLKGNSNTIDSIEVSESVSVHIDRKIYIAGENLLFSFYLLNTQSHELSKGSAIGYVVIQNENSDVIGHSQVKIENGIAAGAIYLPDTIKTGYYHVVAYTNYMRNLPDSNFFTSQILVANRFDSDFSSLILKNQSYKQADKIKCDSNVNSSVKISPSNLVLKKRDKANFTLKISNPDCRFIDLSISIKEKTINATSIAPSRPHYFKLSSDSNRLIYLKEDKYTELQGLLSDPASGKGLPNRQLILTTPDTTTNFNYTQTNEMGQFRFGISDYYADRELFIKIKDDVDELQPSKITFVPKFQGSNHIQTLAWPIDSSLINYIKRSQELIRIQKAFNQSPVQYIKKEAKASSPRLYRHPDYRVYPGEYIELKDFQEISREIIPTLRTRKTDNTYSSVHYDLIFKEILPSNSAFFVDGIFTNIASVIPFNSKEIKRIDVISSPWYYNNMKLWGVISIFSKNSLWKTITLTKGYYRMKADGFYEFPVLNHPNDEKKINLREPDFRQLLYWNSHYRLEKEKSAVFDFYTSDYAAKYLIKLSGITDKGEIIEENMEIEVID